LDHLPQVGGGFGSSTTSWRRIWIVYHKSKEDLDCLLQAEGRLASIHQRALVPDDYSNFINDALPLSNGHQGLIAPPTWSGRPGHWKGTSPPRYPAQPTFLRLQLGRAGPGIGRVRVLQATRLSPPFCASNLIEWAQALEGQVSSKLPGSAHLSTTPTQSGGPRHCKGMSPPSYPAQPTFLRFQLGRAGSGIGRAQSPPIYPVSPPFCVFNLVGQARVSEGHRVL
jgi:hypothetical protein